MKYCFIKKVISLFFIISGLCLSLVAIASVFAESSGEELYRQGKYEEAYNAFTKADMDRPKDIYNRYNRGCAAAKNQDNEAAEAAFTSVLSRADGDDISFRAFYNRGVAALKQGNMDMAVDDFKSALKLNPLDKDTLFNFELALLQKKISEQKKQDQQKDNKDNKDQSDKKQDSSCKDKKDKKDKKSEQKESENSKNQDNQQDKKQADNKKEQENKKNSREGAEQNINKNKDEESDKDLSGDLSGSKQKNQPKPSESYTGKLQMDKNRAKALLDNAHDDPSALIRAMGVQEKQVSSSGKKW